MQHTLETAEGRKRLANIIHAEVEEATELHFRDGFRRHLGSSIIGHDCARYLWLNFRWAAQERVEGRMRRLWDRGHLEEPRMIAWLRMVGFTVHEFDHEEDGETQYRITGSEGHFGGSLDSVAELPERYGLGPVPLLAEYKTHNDKSFKLLLKDGMEKSKPQHYKQMCSYGAAYKLQYGLYCAVNKNDDTLHYEIVELDWAQADDLYRKADHIIFTQIPPRKVNDSPAFYLCKMCSMIGVCHLGEAVERNCRSCINARPIEDKQWWCEIHSHDGNAPIPDEVIPNGCHSWKAIV